MKLETYNTKLIFTAIFLFSIFLFSTSVSAAGLIPCGRCAQFGTDSNGHTICKQPSEGATSAEAQPCTVCHFFVLIQNIIILILLIFASLATLAAIYIAFLFMFSGGSPAKITDAKGNLWNLVKGIAVILGSWLVLNTIINLFANPQVFPLPWNEIKCEVSKPSLQFQPPPGAPVELGELKAKQLSGGGVKLNEQEARNQLQQAGITVNKNPCPIGVGYQGVPGGCTSLDGVNTSTIEKAIQLKNECKCVLKITGGTELGHTEGGATNHASGSKLDFSPNSALDQYIVNNFTYLGLRTGGAKVYEAPDGSIYAREFDHWDVTFVK